MSQEAIWWSWSFNTRREDVLDILSYQACQRKRRYAETKTWSKSTRPSNPISFLEQYLSFQFSGCPILHSYHRLKNYLVSWINFLFFVRRMWLISLPLLLRRQSPLAHPRLSTKGSNQKHIYWASSSWLGASCSTSYSNCIFLPLLVTTWTLVQNHVLFTCFVQTLNCLTNRDRYKNGQKFHYHHQSL